MTRTIVGYRVDWPSGSPLGLQRFWGADEYRRLLVHLDHFSKFDPVVVPLIEASSKEVIASIPAKGSKWYFGEYAEEYRERMVTFLAKLAESVCLLKPEFSKVLLHIMKEEDEQAAATAKEGGYATDDADSKSSYGRSRGNGTTLPR